MEPPNQIVILPSTTLTIPSPAPHATHPRLKISVTPHLLVPSPPFAPGVSGRKVEGCVDIVVGIGEKVNLRLEVEEEGLEELCEGVSNGWEGMWTVEEEVKKRVRGLFQANISNLALTRISQPGVFSAPTATPLPLVQLSPLISDPSHSSLLKILTTTGRPQAYLTKFDIKLEWTSPRVVPGDVEKEGDEIEEESQDSQDSQASWGGHEWDEDEFCDPDDGMEVDAADDALLLEDEELELAVRRGEIGREDGLPVWAGKQLKEGIHKLMRTHMIRRFPLLFDAGLITHAPSLRIHRALTSSLTHFLTLSSARSRSTSLKSCQKSLRSLAQDQEGFVRLNAETASQIRGYRTKSSNKRRKIAHERGKEGIGQGIDPDSPEGRVRDYMVSVNRMISEEDDGPQSDERRLKRLIGEAMGRIGRAKWEARRRGTGKMAAFRVPLVDISLEDGRSTNAPNEEETDELLRMELLDIDTYDTDQPASEESKGDLNTVPFDTFSIRDDIPYRSPLSDSFDGTHNSLLLEIEDFADLNADEDADTVISFAPGSDRG